MIAESFLGLVTALGVPAALTRGHVYRAERRFPPLGAFVEVEGHKLHYVMRGHGRTVVLIHGASANLREWTPGLLDHLSRRYRVIAIDRPGHGYSARLSVDGHDPRVQARLIHGALARLGARRPLMVGHSWAGTVVLAYALAFPDEIAGALLLAGVTHPWPGGVGSARAIVEVPFVGTLFRHLMVAPAFHLVAERSIACVFAPEPVPSDYRARAGVELAARPATYKANAQDLTRLKPILTEMAAQYRTLRLPLSIVAAERDNVIWNHLHVEPLAEKVLGSEVEVLAGAGHMAHHTRPEAVIDAINRLAARCDWAG